MKKRDLSRLQPIFRLLAFLLGFGLALFALLAAVITLIGEPGRMETAMTLSVDTAALQTDEESVRAFARETVEYVTSEKEEWEPAISILGLSDFIPQAFWTHMTTLRGLFAQGKSLLETVSALLQIVLVLLLFGWVYYARKPFPRRFFFWGMGTVLLLLTALGIWMAADFNSFWYLFHRWFIPDGIFSASETVMLLFPEKVFLCYLPWMLGRFALYLGLALALSVGAMLLGSRLRARFPSDGTDAAE